jgi:hypothetical protein
MQARMHPLQYLACGDGYSSIPPPKHRSLETMLLTGKICDEAIVDFPNLTFTLFQSMQLLMFIQHCKPTNHLAASKRVCWQTCDRCFLRLSKTIELLIPRATTDSTFARHAGVVLRSERSLSAWRRLIEDVAAKQNWTSQGKLGSRLYCMELNGPLSPGFAGSVCQLAILIGVYSNVQSVKRRCDDSTKHVAFISYLMFRYSDIIA